MTGPTTTWPITSRELMRRVPGMSERQLHYWYRQGVIQVHYVSRGEHVPCEGGPGTTATFEESEVPVARAVTAVTRALHGNGRNGVGIPALKAVADAARHGETSVVIDGVTIGWPS